MENNFQVQLHKVISRAQARHSPQTEHIQYCIPEFKARLEHLSSLWLINHLQNADTNIFVSLCIVLSLNSLGFNFLTRLELFAPRVHSTGKNSPSLALRRAAEEKLVSVGLRLHCFVILLERTLFPCLYFKHWKDSVVFYSNSTSNFKSELHRWFLIPKHWPALL